MTGSAIEWCDLVWNPILGCQKVTRGCKGCYALSEAWMRSHHPNPKLARRFEGLTEKRGGKVLWTGRINVVQEFLDRPLRRQKPAIWFVTESSDLFAPGVPREIQAIVYVIMAICPQHRFVNLTKRPDERREFLEWVADCGPLAALSAYIPSPSDMCMNTAEIRGRLLGDEYARRFFRCQRPSWPLPNVAEGVSVHDQPSAEEAIPELINTPAGLRMVSAEPLIGPLDLRPWLGSLDWVVSGGESGPRAVAPPPGHAGGFDTIMGDCTAAGVAYHHKQNGEWLEVGGKFRRVGKKAAGREIGGRTYDGNPWGVWR